MNVLFFMARPGAGGEELLRSIAPIVPEVRVEAVFDLRGFSERLRRPRDAASVSLIWGPSREDLRNILSLKDLLKPGRTLLVLADQDAETVALAHSLLPAFIAYIDEGGEEILSVLKKLARTEGAGPAPHASF
ncbi:MAG TPA: hypothetical protein VLJ16_04970 [Acidobacteriota bacterium]|nr:hypothetical protein [Acidobacteriota bacterium]